MLWCASAHLTPTESGSERNAASLLFLGERRRSWRAKTAVVSARQGANRRDPQQLGRPDQPSGTFRKTLGQYARASRFPSLEANIMEPKVDPWKEAFQHIIQRKIGQHLRTHYGDCLSEPVPDGWLTLLTQLDEWQSTIRDGRR
jgi:Anti-sigma factor NepR